MLKKILAVAALTIIVCISTPASADLIYSFQQITDNNSSPDAPGSQFTVRVLGSTDAALSSFGGAIDADQVLFVFQNDVGVGSSITDVYFQDGTLLGIASIRQSAGVSFDDPATPGNLPGGNNINPPFVATGDFSADSNTPNVETNGVNSTSEWVGILFNLQAALGYDDVINAINNWLYDPSEQLADRWSKDDPNARSLRFGIHVQSIGDTNTSEGYVSIPDDGLEPGPSVVPEPSSLVLLGMGSIGLFGAFRARRRGANA